MKRLISLLLCAFLFAGCALAEPKTYDFDAMSLAELLQVRSELDAAVMAAYAAQTDSEYAATRGQPAPIGASVRYDGSHYLNRAVTDLTVVQVLRGAEALRLITSFNSYNARPADGEEYLVVLLRAEAVASENGAQAEIYDYDFAFIGADGTEYEYAYAAGVDRELAPLYEGAVCEGYIISLIKEGDQPLMVYLKDADRPLFFDLNSYAPVKLDETEPLETLRRGDISEDVRRMQQALVDMGYLNDRADGNFGRNTEAAVRAYQTAMGLEPTGVADDAVLRLILSYAESE